MNISKQTKKRARRILYIFLAAIVAFAMMMPHFMPASNTAKAASLTLKKTRTSYNYGDGSMTFYKYNVNGKISFCVEMNDSAVEGKRYSKGSYKSKQGISSAQWEQLNRIANIGYNSERKSDAWYCVTQMYVWKKLADWGIKGNTHTIMSWTKREKTNISGYSKMKETITKELKEMNSALSKKPSFNEKTIKITQGQAQSFKVKDTNKVLSKAGYKVTSTPSGVTAKISGNTLVITTSATAKTGKVNVAYKANNPVGGKSYFYSSTSQNLATLGKFKSNSATVKLSYEKVETADFDFNKEVTLNDDADFSLLNDDEDIDLTKFKFAIYADEDISVSGKVKYKEDEKIAEASADKDGNVSFEDLYAGHYYIKETAAAPGIATSDTEYKVTVEKDSSSGKLEAKADGSAWDTEGEDNTITDTPTTIELSKYDATGKNEVPGAEMRLADESGETVTEWTSTNEPYIIQGLEAGKTYSLFEDTAPDGYVKNPEVVTFKVEDTGEVQRQNMNDKQVFFYKTDEDGKVLSGASFTVVDKDGKTVEEFTADYKDAGKTVSEAEGYTLSGLTEGETYTVKETSAPAGYQRAKDQTFKVESDNKDQTVTMVDKKTKIHTTATINGLHVALNAKDTKEIDAVKIENANKGDKYTLKAKLMFPDGTPVTIDGKEVTGKTQFTAPDENFTQEVEFNYDASELAGKDVVAFESLYTDKDELVSSHEDLNDQDQTVHFPKIKTTATDVNTDSHSGKVAEETTIKDVVPYENLLLVIEYTGTGNLVYKDSGEPVLQDGKEITQSVKFTPQSKDGSFELEFKVNSSLLKGKTTVAFEHVYVGDVEVAVHADLNSEEQSVHFPDIHTTATINGLHVALNAKDTKHIDAVDLTNLVVGQEYTLKSRLVFANGDPVKIDGKELTAETTFTAEKADETKTVEFDYDASTLAGKTVVAFESLYTKDVEIASHEDLNDQNQTVYFPNFKTTATVNGKHTITGEGKKTLTDKISYSNLLAGKEYTAKLTWMDKKTGKPVTVDGKKLTGEAKFTPEDSKGSVTVKTENVDLSKLAGKDIVAFEKIYCDNTLIGTHEDINDKGQTIHIKTPPVTKKSTPKKTVTSTPSVVKTGDAFPIIAVVLIIIIAAAAFVIYRMRKKGVKEEK